MPAYVQTAPYLDRSARVICPECNLEEEYSRTEPAQAAAHAHNVAEHGATPDTKEP